MTLDKESILPLRPGAVLIHRHILILGCGESGISAGQLAIHIGAMVTIIDDSTSAHLHERAAAYENRNLSIELSWNEGKKIDFIPDLVVVSPGISIQSCCYQYALTFPCLHISELEFGYWYCACPLLAITGTNGKTTTVEIVTHCLKAAGMQVISAGNIGLPLTAVVQQSAALDFIVVEVSSFQLELVKFFTPMVAAVLNITEDHLDRYNSFDEYANTKMKLLDNMKETGNLIVNHNLRDFKSVINHPKIANVKITTFTGNRDDLHTQSDFICDSHGNLIHCRGNRNEYLLSASELKINGRHNVENVLAALAICDCAGVPLAVTVTAVKTFTADHHRLEKIIEHQGVVYINDSKATNPDALIQALLTLGSKQYNNVILIAGGRNKRMNFDAVKPFLKKYVKQVYLIGEMSPMLLRTWAEVISCRESRTLADAVHQASSHAVAGDIVLLSPGCSSIDMFANYKVRGETFAQEVKRRIKS